MIRSLKNILGCRTECEITPRRRKGHARSWHVLVVVLVSLAARSAMAQQLTIAVTGPAQSFSLAADPTPSQIMTVFTSWDKIHGSPISLAMCAYMTAPLTGGPGNSDTIAANRVQVNGNTIVSTGGCGISNARQLSAWVSNGSPGNNRGDHTDNVNVRLSGVPATLAADTYRGTIYVIAIVY